VEGARFTQFGSGSHDLAYLLRHAEGYEVESPAGRLGVLEEILFESRPDVPDFLVVRAGFLRRRRHVIAVRDVETIVPHERRVVLRR
jgi:hypothetical protein